MALNYRPFGYGVWFNNGNSGTQGLRLGDNAFRQLILIKALANITSTTLPELNALLTRLFAGRGRCYVQDFGSMRIAFCFEFPLEVYEAAILTQSGVTPRPAGVKLSINQLRTATFGFATPRSFYKPFGYGTFATGLQNAT